MRISHIITAATLALLLLCTSVSAQNGRKSRQQLEQENRQKQAQIDSLRKAIEDYQEVIRVNDSISREMIGIFEENEKGKELRPEDYTPEVTDSLLDLWYKNRQAVKDSDEGEGYDLDSVHFTSNVPDKVLIERLAKMNSYITLPFNETVRNWMVLYSEKMPTKMASMLSLSQFYFPIIEEILNKYDMPDELKYMVVIESAFNPTAVSRAHAKGLWQFMMNTAKSYGLRINSYVDERFDPYKATDAAARYMKDAYRIFGDWNLAISSYNCGSGNVYKAIRKAGGNKDFWAIYKYLPRETRGYVPGFVGAMYGFTYYKEYGLKPADNMMPVAVDTFEIHKPLHFRQVSDLIGIPYQTIKDLNPQYLHDVIPGNDTYILRLPYQYSDEFIANEEEIYKYKADSLFNPATLLEGSSSGTVTTLGEQATYYTVKSGDYLGKIASRNHVTVDQLKKWNHLKSNNLRVGQKLKIIKKVAVPVTPAPSVSAGQSQAADDATKAAAMKADAAQAKKIAADSAKAAQAQAIADKAAASKAMAEAYAQKQAEKAASNLAAEQAAVKAVDKTGEQAAGEQASSEQAASKLAAEQAASKLAAGVKAANEAAKKDTEKDTGNVTESNDFDEKDNVSSSNPTTEVSEDGYQIYTVQKGDTMYGLTKKFPGVTVKEISDLNNIGTSLQIGQKLKIPKK